jgi:tetratricopeptide (TPR) repeat protein
MKKKMIWILALIAVAVVAVVVGFRFFGGKKSVEAKVGAATEYQPIEVSLAVNRSLEAIITPGTPLVFEILIRNAGAAQEALAVAAIEGKKRELDKLLGSNTIAPEVAEKIIADDQAKIRKVPPLDVAVEATMFTFLQEGKNGLTPLPWRPKLAEKSEDRIAALDKKNVAYATFVVAPEATAKAAEETLTVFVQFENSSKETSRWSGRIISDPVIISVVRETGTPDEQFNKHVAMVEYFLALKDYGRAETETDKLLALKPKLIDGLVLRGKALEGKGEFKKALDSYEEALDEFLAQNPNPETPPWEVMENISRMRDKLGIRPPDIIKK